MRARWSVVLLLLVLALGMVAQATDLRCLMQAHCCCSDGLPDDCQANSLQGPAGTAAIAALLVPVVRWVLASPPPQLVELRLGELLPAPREPLVFQPCGLRAPPPVRFNA